MNFSLRVAIAGNSLTLRERERERERERGGGRRAV
jgi:hypothetical protein